MNEKQVPLEQSPEVSILKRKLPIWVGVVFGMVLVLFAIGVVYFYMNNIPSVIVPPIDMPPRDYTSNWKTYINEDYGFEFKYPAEWYVTDEGGEQFIVYLYVPGEPENPDKPINPPSMIIDRITSEGSLETWISDRDNNMADKQEILTESETIIDGYPSVQRVKINKSNPDKNLFVVETIVDFSPDTIWLLYVSSSGEKDVLVDFNNQILSTFKFINPADISDWQSYKNEKHKFNLSYPHDFKIVTDGTHVKYTNDREWYRFVIKNDTVEEIPYLFLEINPDGYGPIFIDKTYRLMEQEDGSVIIKSIEVKDETELNNDKMMVITAGITSQNGIGYSIRVGFKEVGYDYEPLLKQILETFKFTN